LGYGEVSVRVWVMVGVEFGIDKGKFRVKLGLWLGLKLIGHLYKHVHINYFTSHFTALSPTASTSKYPSRWTPPDSGLFSFRSSVRCGISTYSPTTVISTSWVRWSTGCGRFR